MRLTAAVFAAAVVWALLGAGQAWASGSTPYFTALTGAGQSLSEVRPDAIAANLPNGQVLIAGVGRVLSSEGYDLGSAELFNPLADTFTVLTGNEQSPAEARRAAVAATLPDGHVLIAGGSNVRSGKLSGAELFNPATDTFTKLTGPGQSLTQPREDAVAATLPDGRVLIAGGMGEGPADIPGGLSAGSSAELFDPATDTFTELRGLGQSLTEPREEAVAATLPSGEVLIAGGYDATSAELFNPATDTFTKLTGPGESPTEERKEAVAATLPDGEVLIAGGSSRPVGYEPPGPSSAEVFNPATDTFTMLTGAGESPIDVRWGAFAATLPEGQVLIMGGSTREAIPGAGPGSWVAKSLSSAELFYPAAEASIVGGDFGEQNIGQRSALGMLTVTNLGAQVLSIRGTTLTGPESGDFTVVADACAGRTLAPGDSCAITAAFTPTREGAATAALTLVDNESEPGGVTLTGTGFPTAHGPQGPKGETGATGAQGPQGEKGARGATRPAGPRVARGHEGAAGKVKLLSCASKKVKGRARKRCTTERVKSPIKVAANAKASRASLTRAGRLYARGHLTSVHGSTRLALELSPPKALGPGTYTLTLSWKAGKIEHTSRQQITLD